MALSSELPVFLSNDPLINPKVTEAITDDTLSQETQDTQALMTNEPIQTKEMLRDTAAFKPEPLVTEKSLGSDSEPSSASDTTSPVSAMIMSQIRSL